MTPKSIFLLMSLLVFAIGCAEGESSNEPRSAESRPNDTVSNEPAPDGNTEPPLDDVTNALKDIPNADGKTADASSDGNSDIALTVISPDKFNDELAKYKGKVVLIDFWASWCVPCRNQFPHTIELSRQHAKDGLVVLTMSLDDPDSKEQALAFLKEKNATTMNFLSELGDASYDAFGISNNTLPHYKLFARDGNLAKTFQPDLEAQKGIDSADIDKAVAKLLGVE